jgi:hypothetical protein
MRFHLSLGVIGAFIACTSAMAADDADVTHSDVFRTLTAQTGSTPKKSKRDSATDEQVEVRLVGELPEKTPFGQEVVPAYAIEESTTRSVTSRVRFIEPVDAPIRPHDAVSRERRNTDDDEGLSTLAEEVENIRVSRASAPGAAPRAVRGVVASPSDREQTNLDDPPLLHEENAELEPAPLPRGVDQPIDAMPGTEFASGMPLTIGELLYDDVECDSIEPYHCQQMWDCAGGRCQSWLGRAMRDITRTYHVVFAGRCGLCGYYGSARICPPGVRPLCGPVFGSACNVGVWRGCSQERLRSIQSCVTRAEGRGGESCTAAAQHDCTESCSAGCTAAGADDLGCTTPSSNATGSPMIGRGAIGRHLLGRGNRGSGICFACGGMRGGRQAAASMSTWAWLWGDHDPGFTVAAWNAVGYHSRANGLFNNHPHRFSVHQSNVYIERSADTSTRRADWGFRADVMYGLDAQDTQAFGGIPGRWDFQNGFDHGSFGWALPQAYGELAFGNTSVIVGHFYTLMGYEVIPAPDNFFYSHAMTMFNSEPFTHTGALATYSGSGCVDFYYGWTLGWDTGFDQFGSGNSFLGGFKLNILDVFSATYMTSFGDFGRRGSGYAHSIVMATNAPGRIGYVVQSDLLRVQGEDNVGVNQYLFYELSDRLSVGTRLEWWKGDDITGYAPYGSQILAPGSFSYYGATVGANIHLGNHLVIRPEGRVDWSPALGYSEGIGAVDMVVTY